MRLLEFTTETPICLPYWTPATTLFDGLLWQWYYTRMVFFVLQAAIPPPYRMLDVVKRSVIQISCLPSQTYRISRATDQDHIVVYYLHLVEELPAYSTLSDWVKNVKNKPHSPPLLQEGMPHFYRIEDWPLFSDVNLKKKCLWLHCNINMLAFLCQF